MDWETRFASIVEETESNLSKVKERLGSARASSHMALAFNSEYPYTDKIGIHDKLVSTSRLDPLLATTGSSVHNSYHGINSRGSSLPAQLSAYSSQLGATYNTIEPFDSSLPKPLHSRAIGLDSSPAVASLLQERLDVQQTNVENLSHTVQKLEKERDLYMNQVKSLRDEMVLLNSRMAERGVDLHTEQKMEQWKKDVMMELQLVQSQLQLQRTRDDELGSYSRQTTSLLRDMQDLKRSTHDEYSTLRREVDNVKTRLAKLEDNMDSVSSSNRDLSRRQDHMDQSMRELTASNHKTTLERSQSDTQNDRLELSDLQSSIRSIGDKLNHLEHAVEPKLGSSKKPNKSARSKPRRLRRPPSADIFSPSTSDLDLTDSTELGVPSTTSPSRSHKLSSDFEKELDLTDTFNVEAPDLDLSTDDLSNLSSDPLEFDDLK